MRQTVRVEKTEDHVVEIDPRAVVLELRQNWVRSVVTGYSSAFIKDSIWIVSLYYYGGSHGWSEETEIRAATPEEEATYNSYRVVLKQIEQA